MSQAYGARDIRDCHRWFFDGLTLAALMAVPIMARARAGVVRHSSRSAFTPRCGRCSSRTSASLILSTPFLLAYAACRRYLQGMHAVTPVMFALVTANLINAGRQLGA